MELIQKLVRLMGINILQLREFIYLNNIISAIRRDFISQPLRDKIVNKILCS
ncbi:hypothetical protein VIBNISO65_1110071 [Vibrio nigripulchritudo SO65]|nr:hypothetical protein VIBNIAM115_1260037 [Vibrio nigripulchritudo AM115]CCN41915.1 hypothetical protein VIBNIFTn2_210166 [Vibrio nigripulchritudo FTn2]CCN66292.1 hypothetical protein VIBNIPon4_530077 [Vibrio nigripulchritudo POn4]CCN74649.1 hypothetical protein VIBNISO65_1110071 [Vibrio nigripulchritudo SO65]